MIAHFTAFQSIIVTGSIAYDDIMVFPGYFKDFFQPEKLHQINVSFVVDSLVKHIGGTATNIAYNVRMYTDKKIYVIGALGQDHERITDFFKKHAIDFSGSHIDNKLYCSTGKVMTDNSDNQIWGYYYGASEKGSLVDFAPYAKKTFGIISANHEKAFLHAQSYFIKHKLPYLYDPGMALTWIKDADLAEGLEHATFLVGNDYEISHILARLAMTEASITSKGIGLITTLGAQGVRYTDSENTFTVSGFAVKKFLDPTGAGDAWRGGFIAALINGKKIDEALKIANALASFAVEKHGTANHTPTKKQIEARAQALNITN